MPESTSAEQPVAASAPSPSVPSAPTPSTPPGPPKSTLRQVLEAVVDLAAIAVAGGLAWVGKVDGNVALVVVALLAGVRVSDFVSAKSNGGGGPTGPGAGGIAGGVLWLIGHLAPRAQHAAGLTVLGLSLALAGCPIPPPDGCPPRATRCSPAGVPQVCTLGQYWSAPRPETPCAVGSVCCWTRSPYGRELHACVPREDCMIEPPLIDAGAEGGAQ
jgi:hypothetical protein